MILGKVKVCYVIPDLGHGGAQKQLLELLTGIDRDTFELVVINLHRDLELSDFRTLETKIVRLPHRGRGDLGKIFSLASILNKERPHIVHCILTSANFYGVLAAILAGIPRRIVSERSIGNRFQGIRKHVYPVIYRWASIIVTNSEASKRYLQETSQILPSRIKYVPNGCKPLAKITERELNEKKREFRINPEDFVIGTVTHLSEDKDCSCLVRATAELLKLDQNIKCVIVGEGPSRGEIEEQIRKTNTENYVILAGYRERSEAMAIMKIFDCFPFPSLMDGMPNALMEAMSVSLPCVASPVGGIPELVIEGETGFLFETGNHMELANKIARIKRDREFAREIGRKAQKKILQEFSVETMVRAYEELYLGLMAYSSVNLR